MQGIVFVIREKDLADGLGQAFLSFYRETLGETAASTPLLHHSAKVV